MEISGAVLRRSPISSAAGFREDAGGSFFGPSVGRGGRRARISARPSGALGGGGGGFSDEGHMQYYLLTVRCGGRKKEEKKRARLVKGFSKDLSAFCSTGFGLETRDGMVGVKGNMMTEATELLLAQLKQLRAEEKELKRKRKQEKAAMKAARLKDGACQDTTSSKSSDGECETAVRTSNLRALDVAEPKPDTLDFKPEAPVCNQLSERAVPTEALVCNQAPLTLDFKPEWGIEVKPARECCSSSKSSAVDRIEVCMGGKCKRSGALELLEELERRVGIEGSVVGCKCMGKCRDGPNVRFMNLCNEEDPVKSPTNPLCIGVGLEDVGEIVANFFGDKKDVGLLPA